MSDVFTRAPKVGPHLHLEGATPLEAASWTDPATKDRLTATVTDWWRAEHSDATGTDVEGLVSA